MPKTPPGGIQVIKHGELAGSAEASTESRPLPDSSTTPTRKLPSSKPAAQRRPGRYSFIAPPMPDGDSGDAEQEAALPSTAPPPPLPGDEEA